MRMRSLCTFAAMLVAAPAVNAQTLDVKEWPVEWQGRTRDPDVDGQGRVWFVGQTGNYIANFDPKTETFKRFEIEAGTNPHNLIAGSDGAIWYAGNANGRIGRLDPATGQFKVFMMPDAAARDPHTLLMDGKGNIWFTVQGGGFVGRINMQSGQIQLVKPEAGATRPYGISLDSKGQAWVNLFGNNRIAVIDPTTFQARTVATPRETARTRRIVVTPDDAVWYVDYAGGMLGRIDPKTGAIKEWLTPGGAGSQPYALVTDERGRLWFSETARGAAKLVGFDPATEKFTHVTPVSNTIRHMVYHRPTKTIWFGTDSNNIGRAIIP